jgi:hypothetical protein
MKRLTLSVLISSILVSGASYSDSQPAPIPPASPGEEYSWVHQFGTDKVDSANAVATFGASVYVAGAVDIDVNSSPYGGKDNGYVRRYDLWGNLISELPFGELQKAEANAVFVDETGIYVAGNTLTPPAFTGNPDILVVKYNHAGKVIWSQQFGAGGPDHTSGIVADATGVYVVGSFSLGHSGFIYKFDRNGKLLWNQKIGHENGHYSDWISAVTVDHTGIYVTGGLSDINLDPEHDSLDAFVRKYDTSGNEIWNRQFGTEVFDSGTGVSVAKNGVYVVGGTNGTLQNQQSARGPDAFIRKYDTYGTEIWTRQFGSDSASDVVAKGNSVYMTGTTSGTLPGETALGDSDAFMRVYDSNGNELTTIQFGTDKSDSIEGITKNWSGLYVVGSVLGTLPGQTATGRRDAFVANLRLPNCWESLENWENYCANTW